MIRRVIERIFASEEFLSDLINKISVVVGANVENVIKVCSEKVRDQLHNNVLNINKLIDDQEQFARYNNLRIYGDQEESGENLQEKVIKLFEDKLDIKLNRYGFDSCYRFRGREGSNMSILVRFYSHQIRQEVCKNKSKLKGSRIVIREDLTRRRVEIFKQACEKLGPKNV